MEHLPKVVYSGFTKMKVFPPTLPLSWIISKVRLLQACERVPANTKTHKRERSVTVSQYHASGPNLPEAQRLSDGGVMAGASEFNFSSSLYREWYTFTLGLSWDQSRDIVAVTSGEWCSLDARTCCAKQQRQPSIASRLCIVYKLNISNPQLHIRLALPIPRLAPAGRSHLSPTQVSRFGLGFVGLRLQSS